MRFGINTFLFTSPFANQSTRLFKTFKKWGFETVEIPIEDPSHIDPAFVKKELDGHGLVCGSVCACMGPGRDFRGAPAEQQTGMDAGGEELERTGPIRRVTRPPDLRRAAQSVRDRFSQHL